MFGNAFLDKNSDLSMIEGKFVNLRALEIEDLEIHKKWRNDKINRKHTREYRLLNMINQREWFEFISKDNPPKNIMFGVTNKQKKLIGVCGLTYIDWKNKHCEISIILYKSKWQSTKEAKDTISILINYGFGELNMHRLWVEIFDTIPENMKLFESMNFKKEGMMREKLWRDRKWHDSIIYSKLVTDKR